jgi:hypothetical protein
MATQPIQTVNPIRPGFLTITPYLIVNEAAELIDFVKNVFGAEEKFRSIGSAGGLHCELKLGDSMLMIGGGGAWRGAPTPSALHVYVPDVDPVYDAPSPRERRVCVLPPTRNMAIATLPFAIPTATTGISARISKPAQVASSRKAYTR